MLDGTQCSCGFEATILAGSFQETPVLLPHDLYFSCFPSQEPFSGRCIGCRPTRWPAPPMGPKPVCLAMRGRTKRWLLWLSIQNQPNTTTHPSPPSQKWEGNKVEVIRVGFAKQGQPTQPGHAKSSVPTLAAISG